MEKIKRLRTPEEIFDSIRKIHGDIFVLDTSTYNGVNSKARFMDSEYGEHWMLPKTALKGSGHPIRGAKKAIASRIASRDASVENGERFRNCIHCDKKNKESLFHFDATRKKYSNACEECWQKNRKSNNSRNSESNNKSKRKYALENPDKVKKSKKKWKEANIGKVKADKAKRKARILQATPKWLTELQLKAIEHAYFMADLRTQCFDDKYHVDHIIPICGKNVCRLNVPWNLEVIKESENLSKGNKLLTWRAECRHGG